MKTRIVLLAPAAALFLIGCGPPEVVDVPHPERMERKAFEDMNPEEQIRFIEMTPMDRASKDREIASIRAAAANQVPAP